MFKNRSRLLFVVMVLTIAISVVGCGSSDSEKPAASEGNGGVVAEVKGLEEAFAESPVILTSVGQSADVEMVKALMDNAGIEHTMDKVVGADAIGDQKTLILAVGGSSKGLGAAGIDADTELARTNELIDAAKDKGIKIIAMHVGGQNRRGELSDKFIEPSLSKADYIIIVADGDSDGLFTSIASKNAIPMDSVTSIADAIEPLKGAFK